MNTKAGTPISFAPVEQKIDRVCARVTAPDVPQTRQHVVLSHLIRHIQTAQAARSNAFLREYELNAVSFTALMMLFSSPECALNPSELADATGESRANVTRICDELVSKQLLTRTPNAEDRRRVDLRLALEGDELVQRFLPQMRDRVHNVFNVLSQDERDTLENLLKRVLTELG
ncbi:MarR family transcriptional regulator [Jeongeupia naejangsanensis]|uniref:MarR family transcriptional regulator n=1 Tax=Jeongeupia naejangsanensis TaxID=613195 RepID=A0ABS2BJI1_9NEIS|nr:MarR family transcriptional regulator [Jeongeupia naejangsanensis]MBM3115749.1 MarR family transcriptional regulator [Jeongeupia naejangsanensis]